MSDLGEISRQLEGEQGVINPSGWHLYVLETARGALYTGITTDVTRRFCEHQKGKRGARSLRGKGPLRLLHHEPLDSHSEALKLEAWLKKQSASDKRAWLAAQHTLI